MPDLLLGHILQQESVLGSQAGSVEVLIGVSGETVMQEIQLNPFLVQATAMDW
jgi:hypothetical protein